jgi:hypothetical protein
MATADTKIEGAAETPRQKAIREMRERLERERKKKGQGPYQAPTRIEGPTRLNK